MDAAPRAFADFLSRAHSRRLAWRFVEHAGMGLLWGCGLGALIVPLLWWRGDEPVVPVIAVLCVATVAGFVAALRRTPSMLDTAMLADHLLGTPDLLSSALMTMRSQGAGNAFADTVLAQADARVSGVSPSDIAMRRLGGRGWTGIALATAAVLAIAAMTSTPTGGIDSAAIASVPGEEWTAQNASQRVESSAHDAADSQHSSRQAATSGHESTSDSSDGTTRGSAQERGLQGAGTGAGQSKTGFASPVAPMQSSDQGEAKLRDGSALSGILGAKDPEHGDVAPGLSASPSTRQPVPAWASPAWPGDRAAALRAAQNGTIADRYRPLVKEYFDAN